MRYLRCADRHAKNRMSLGVLERELLSFRQFDIVHVKKLCRKTLRAFFELGCLFRSSAKYCRFLEMISQYLLDLPVYYFLFILPRLNLGKQSEAGIQWPPGQQRWTSPQTTLCSGAGCAEGHVGRSVLWGGKRVMIVCYLTMIRPRMYLVLD